MVAFQSSRTQTTTSMDALEDLRMPLSLPSLESNDNIDILPPSRSRVMVALNFKDDEMLDINHFFSHEPQNDCFGGDGTTDPASSNTFHLAMKRSPTRNPFNRHDGEENVAASHLQPWCDCASESGIAPLPPSFSGHDMLQEPQTPQVVKQTFVMAPPPFRPGEYTCDNEYGRMNRESARQPSRKLMLPDF